MWPVFSILDSAVLGDSYFHSGIHLFDTLLLIHAVSKYQARPYGHKN